MTHTQIEIAFVAFIAIGYLVWLRYMLRTEPNQTRTAGEAKPADLAADDEPPRTLLPTRAPGQSFGDWADNALATFDDEDTTREGEATRRADILLTATWIEHMTCDQFNAAVVLHLDTPSR